MISCPWKGLKGLLFVVTTLLCIDGADLCDFPLNMTIQNETRTHAHMHTQYIFSTCMISRSQWHQYLSPGLISQNDDANCLWTAAIFFTDVIYAVTGCSFKAVWHYFIKAGLLHTCLIPRNYRLGTYSWNLYYTDESVSPRYDVLSST